MRQWEQWLLFMSNVLCLKQALEIADDSFSIINIANNSPIDYSSEDIVPLSGEVPCSNETIEKPEVFVPDKSLGTDMLSTQIPGTPSSNEEEAKDKSREKCIDCGLAPEWNWQIKPIFLLEGLENLLNSINDCIDNMMDQLDPYKFLNGLCPFLDKFAQAQCEVDLRALLALIGMLISRYSLSCMKLTLNWSVLIGPIIKAIVDMIATLIEQIMQYVSYIFSCMRTFLETISNAINEASRVYMKKASVCLIN